MILETNKGAGTVLSDNVLFEAGLYGEDIRKQLLEGFSFYTPTSDLLDTQRAWSGGWS